MTAPRLQNSAPGGAGEAAAAGAEKGARAGPPRWGTMEGGGEWKKEEAAAVLGPPRDWELQKVSGRPAEWQVGPAAAPHRATSAAPAAAAGPRA